MNSWLRPSIFQRWLDICLGQYVWRNLQYRCRFVDREGDSKYAVTRMPRMGGFLRGTNFIVLRAKGNHRHKPTIEYDPKVEKTMKKNRSRVKAQRALQFEEQTANSDEGASEKFSEEEIVEENSEEEIQDNMADNANNQRRTLADYTNPTNSGCGSSIIWPTVVANTF
ncbi:hypothetical protein PIB30_048591 [Stylosanthes scabra]|uniref:Uncharacterized protein n=1 Tax=Stylosanthes scabra TaxID=79078 RepID=A0ABU6ZFU2_9FABA|nr:hypothetical protein [Stylosanthes scabra]